MSSSRPHPPGSTWMEELLARALRDLPGGVLGWDLLSSARYPGWVGVRLATGEWIGRSWSFDVVADGSGALVLRPEMDLVAVKVWDATRPWVRAKLVCDLPEGREEIEIPAGCWPPPPWKVDVATGWSESALACAVAGWVRDRLGREDLLLVERGADPTVAVGPLVRATEAVFDEMLAMDPADSALLCSVLAAFAEALAA